MAEITDAELAELKRKAHAFDSEQGRLQKTQTELEAERAKRVAAEGRLAAQSQAAPAAGGVDPRAAELFGADGVNVLQGMLAPVLGKLDTIGRQFEERAAADTRAAAERTYQSALGTKLAENNLPGFAGRLYGGDLSAAWAQFVESRPSIKRAQAEGDIETVSDVISIFIHQNKELVTGGGFAPTALSGAASAVKTEYSDADYQRDISALDRKLQNCAITEEEHQKQSNAIYDRWVAAQAKAESSAARFGLA